MIPGAWLVLLGLGLAQSGATMEELAVGGGGPQDHDMHFDEELDSMTEGGWIVEGVQKMLDSPTSDWSSLHLFFPTGRLMKFIGQHPLSGTGNVTQSPTKVRFATKVNGLM
jgi:hypothetical protein